MENEITVSRQEVYVLTAVSVVAAIFLMVLFPVLSERLFDLWPPAARAIGFVLGFLLLLPIEKLWAKMRGKQLSMAKRIVTVASAGLLAFAIFAVVL